MISGFRRAVNALLAVVLMLPMLAGGGGTAWAATDWQQIDGGGTNGVNADTSKNAYSPVLAVLNNELYAAWYEIKGSVNLIRIKKYNGGTSWTSVDDGNGLNMSIANTAFDPKLVVFDNALYAAWAEYNGTARQLRVKKYNGGTSWTSVDAGGATGLNRNDTKHVYGPNLAVFNGALFASWYEHDGTADQLYVKKYNGGTSWTSVDGDDATGLNVNPIRSVSSPTLAATNDALYAAWIEVNGSVSQLRVKKYTGGTSWTSADGGSVGLNVNPSQGANSAALTVVNDVLYAAWTESNGGSNQLYVKKYNGGASWTRVDGDGTNGLNTEASQIAERPLLAASNNTLFVVWNEYTRDMDEWGMPNSTPYQLRVKKYNGGTSWTSVDGGGAVGLNVNTSSSAHSSGLAALGNRLYAAWQETNGTANQIRVASYSVVAPARLDGEGTSEEPWEIMSEADLALIGTADYPLSGIYKLMNSIQLENEWTPIGQEDDVGFTGVFDGNGKTIGGLRIDLPGERRVGLFSRIVNGQVYNLKVQADSVTGKEKVGILTGEIVQSGENRALISLVSVEGDVSGETKVGGLVGSAYGNKGSNLLFAYNHAGSGSVTGDRYVGGLAGSWEGGWIYNSHSEAAVVAQQDVGGLLGYASEAVVQRSYSTGTVGTSAVPADYAGGLIGTSLINRINASYSVGKVTGNEVVGGLIGYSDRDLISQSYAASEIDATSVQTGGLIGLNDQSQSNVAASYWDTEASGKADDDDADSRLYGTGRNSSQMKEEVTFTSTSVQSDKWDFEHVWYLETNRYPQLYGGMDIRFNVNPNVVSGQIANEHELTIRTSSNYSVPGQSISVYRVTDNGDEKIGDFVNGKLDVPFTLDITGVNDLTLRLDGYYLIDQNGNKTSVFYPSIEVDSTSPVWGDGAALTVDDNSGNVVLAWDSASDGEGSGVVHYLVYVNGEVAQVYGTTHTVISPPASAIYEVEAVDRAGNKSTRLSIGGMPSTTTLTGSADVTLGQAAFPLYIATVTGAPSHMQGFGYVYGGTLAFYVDGVLQQEGVAIASVLTGMAPFGTFSYTNLTEGVHTVKAVYSGYTGDFHGTNYAVQSSEATFQVTVASAPVGGAPSAPTGLTATPGDQEVALSWNPVANATGYHIYMGSAPGVSPINTVRQATVTDATYGMTGLTNGTPYYFVVTAYNGAGESAASAEQSATPQSGGAQASAAVLTADRTTIRVGERITFSASITGAPEAETLTGKLYAGSVTFKVDGVAVQTVPLGTSSVAIYSTSGLAQGTHTIEAVYSGFYGQFHEVNYRVAGSSAAVAVTINKAESNNGNGAPYPPTSPIPETTDNGTDILINGKAQNAGTAMKSIRNGQHVTTIAIDPKKLADKLKAEVNGSVITIPVAAGPDVVIGELNGRMIKDMEEKQAVLEIRTDRGAYTLPALMINIDAISDKVGKSVALEDIKVQIEIAVPAADKIKWVENAAERGSFKLVVPPVEFTVHGTYGDQAIEVAKFNAYVARTIAVPKDVDPGKVTTGVVIDLDGTPRHVPTKIVVVDGKHYAQINSLTNSTYAVVWHPLEFADMAKHWAKDAVNDMGARMIIEGTGNGQFSPDRTITRAEFAAIVVRALGLKPESGAATFSDVKASDWYSSSVGAAYGYQLIGGLEDGTFRPMDKVTREQAMVILSNAMKLTGLKAKPSAQPAEATLGRFEDAQGVSAWARSGVADVVQAGLASGRSAVKLAPKDYMTRAEAATLIQRLLRESDLI